MLLGPPPLFGALIAASIWFAVSPTKGPPSTEAGLPPWAKVSKPPTVSSTDAPEIIEPRMELPPPGPNGIPAGFVTGWQGGIQPVEIDATMDADVLPTRIAQLDIDTADLPLDRIIAAGPESGRFVGVGTAALAVRSSGIYALTLRVEHDDGALASCLQRLVFGGKRLVSSLIIDMRGEKTTTYTPIAFSLTPGLYPIAVAFGCWNGQKETGAGHATVLIRHPGEDKLRPASPNEILRQVPRRTHR